MNNAFRVNFQLESDDLDDDDQVVLDDETPAPGMLDMPCRYRFEVTFDRFQSESDDQDDYEIVLDHETQATGMLNMPCGYCICTTSIIQ